MAGVFFYKQKTAYEMRISDWSSDVCSSDLIGSGQGTQNQNVNVNEASTFNLRGIGPSATLTLLNGNRFAYSGTQSVIDISAIPTAAVERIEIVADGASAIYGADAVAGVVNILLRKDYEGVTTSARLGGSTDGGRSEEHTSELQSLMRH